MVNLAIGTCRFTQNLSINLEARFSAGNTLASPLAPLDPTSVTVHDIGLGSVHLLYLETATSLL